MIRDRTDTMTTPDAFDSAARANWRDAGDAISPALQGRLRAVRRTALAGDAAPRRSSRAGWIGVPVALTAALAIALVAPQWMPSQADAPTVATRPVTPVVAPAIDAPVVASASGDVDVLTLEDDPDFYLWLDGDDALAAASEVRHDSI